MYSLRRAQKAPSIQTAVNIVCGESPLPFVLLALSTAAGENFAARTVDLV